MKIKINISTQERKGLVAEIGEIMGISPVYAGAGGNVIEGERYRFSYVVMDITVSKDCEVVWDDRNDNEAIQRLFDGLEERGYDFERPVLEVEEGESETPAKRGIMDVLVEELNANAADGEQFSRLYSPPTIIDGKGRKHGLDGRFAPQVTTIELPEIGATADDVITVEIPKNGSLSDERFQNLLKLAESRRNLIAKALGRPLVINDCGDSVQFVFPHSDEVGIANIYGQFAVAMMKYVKRHQRVTATERGVENEKFSMRTFLVKLGMNGSEFSETRKWFSRNLSGNAAFLTDESRQRWADKHQKGGDDNA